MPDPHPVLLNCDLTVLAYQLYHQTVIWPHDPWYEILARGGTDRRTHFMEQVRDGREVSFSPHRRGKIYGGHASIRGLGDANVELDPIVTNYHQMRPRAPAWSGDGAVFLAMRAPDYIVNKIRHVKVATYQGHWSGRLPHGSSRIEDIHSYDDGEDTLIGFEGGTGSYNESGAIWSLMGYVLKRTRSDGHAWDAHIVFRGSRSGNAARAATKAMSGTTMTPRGNADWVTDLNCTSARDAYLGGEVAGGFAAAVKRCMGTMLEAFHYLKLNHGAPETISVAGHSLGAALASVTAGAMSSKTGTLGEHLRSNFSTWPWATPSGYYYALPPTGTEAYCAAYNLDFRGRTYAPYVAGDAVVECSKTVPSGQTSAMGTLGWLSGGGNYTAGNLIRFARPPAADGGENSHELYLIRDAIVEDLRKDFKAFQFMDSRIVNATTWGTFASFTDMLDGKALSFVRPGADPAKFVTRENLRDVLDNYQFDEHFGLFLKILKEVVGSGKAFRGAHKSATYELMRERVELVLSMMDELHVKFEKPDPAAAGGLPTLLSLREREETSLVADRTATQVAALIAYDAASRAFWSGKAKSNDDATPALPASVTLEPEEMLGLQFNLRIGLGIVLQAFQRQRDARLEEFSRFPDLAGCLQVQLDDIEKWQKTKAATP